MATLKSKDLKQMSKEERQKKIEELKLELLKSRSNVGKSGSVKIREIKKIIARLKTIDAEKNAVQKKS